jgi:hypothetical protein
MLRPRITDSSSASAVQALRSGALAVGREVLDFLDGLSARELEAFWASCKYQNLPYHTTLVTHTSLTIPLFLFRTDSRANFTLISSFFLHLFVSAEVVDDARECLGLLEGWRAALRLKSRSCDLLNLALLRLDGVFVRGLGELVELGEGARVVWGERGGT